MILIIDNYDSFTFNLYQYIGSITEDVTVIRNDEASINEILELNFSKLVISPGPGYLKDAGVSIELIKRLYDKKPILGVCLGHQSIAEAFGGKIVHAKNLFHGKSSKILLQNVACKLFDGIMDGFSAARYHSLVADKNTLPSCLSITALSDDGEIMGIKHKDYPVYGVQFHPESIITEHGMNIIENFIKLD